MSNQTLDIGEPSVAVKSIMLQLEKGELSVSELESPEGCEAVRRFCRQRKSAGAAQLTEQFKRLRNGR